MIPTAAITEWRHRAPWALSEQIEQDLVVHCFRTYMDAGGTPVSRAEFERNLAAKRTDRAFLGDVPPLLASSSAGWRGEEALDRVLAEFVARLPGEPWAGPSR